MTESTDSPTAPAPVPPGDFTTSDFWTSPSTYLTLVTYALPLLNLALGRDVSAEAQAVANLAPIVATGVLLVMRGRAKKVVTEANLELAKFRMSYTPQDGNLETRVDRLEQLLPRAVDELRELTRAVDELRELTEEEVGEAELQETLERVAQDERDSKVRRNSVGLATQVLFNGAWTDIPRTKSGKIDGRTAVGSFAKRSGLE